LADDEFTYLAFPALASLSPRPEFPPKGGRMFSTKALVGLAIVAAGLALPIIVSVGKRIYLADLSSYGGPPNQGAMFLAYQALLVSIFVGGCLVSGGLVFTIMSLRIPPTKTADRQMA